MVSSKTYTPDIVDGTVTKFLSDVIIKSEQYCRVYVADTLTNGAPAIEDLAPVGDWVLVDNYIHFYTAPVNKYVVIEVATSTEELGDILAGAAVERAEAAADEAEAARDASEASATSANNDASSASSNATEALTSATNASTSATNAATSEANAATSATNASTSAGQALTYSQDAGTYATSAYNSKVDAETAKTAAESALDSFTDLYLGAKEVDPALDNNGDALQTGAMYFNSVAGEMRTYNGSVWVTGYVDISGHLASTSNPHSVTAAQVGLGPVAWDSGVGAFVVPKDAVQNDSYGTLYTTNTGSKNSSITAHNGYGGSQLMKWDANGTRLGNRYTSNGGSGHLYLTTGNDVVSMTIDDSHNVNTTGDIYHGANDVFNNGNALFWWNAAGTGVLGVFSVTNADVVSVGSPSMQLNLQTANSRPQFNGYEQVPIRAEAYVTDSGVLIASMGISSVVKEATGQYLITLSRAFNSANDIHPIATIRAISSTYGCIRADAISASQIRVFTSNTSGTATDAYFNLIVPAYHL